ncbi:hypothetical protein CA85_49860 [Allorhodopirellula solitaria]|uniref:Uncharacterized protein n=1 Tax=Allorhodopirellula solitaria TaxID=2527987 RepID=A0A5C5WZ78_9BACT|nr:hypothetical protein CA85_49860 [Allorhodopirellula solitaria]
MAMPPANAFSMWATWSRISFLLLGQYPSRLLDEVDLLEPSLSL